MRVSMVADHVPTGMHETVAGWQSHVASARSRRETHMGMAHTARHPHQVCRGLTQKALTDKPVACDQIGIFVVNLDTPVHTDQLIKCECG